MIPIYTEQALEEKRQADLQREQLSEKDDDYSESASGTDYGQSAQDALNLSHRQELEDRLARLLIVRQTLHTTRENVNLIQEIIRQAFLLPLVIPSSDKSLSESGSSISGVTSQTSHHNRQKDERRSEENVVKIVIRTFNWVLSETKIPIWCEEPKMDGSPEDLVRVGTQPALHCFILFSSNVFLIPKTVKLTEEQLEAQVKVFRLLSV